MSGGFSFPPPPPPPPKPTSDQLNHQQYDSTGRGRGRGRGHLGGEFDQWGRGHGGRGGNVAFASQPGRGRGASQPSHPASSHAQNNYSGSLNYHDPNNTAYAQSGGNAAYDQAQASAPQRTSAGHKRKLDALRGPQPNKNTFPGPQSAPPVPSFGASIPFVPSLPAKPVNGGAQSGVNKPPGRRLGLVPIPGADAQESSGSEEEKELDEEAMYAELGDKLTFEHNGVVMSLKSQADLAAWKKDRRQNWPTAARMTERYMERFRVGEERKRLLAGADILQPAARRQAKPRITGSLNPSSIHHEAVPKVQVPPQQDNVAPRDERLALLRHKVAQSEMKNRDAKARLGSDSIVEAEKIVDDSAGRTELSQLSNQTLGLPAGAETVDANMHDAVADGLKEEVVGHPNDRVLDPTLEVTSKVSSDLDSDSDDSAPEMGTSKSSAISPHTRERPICRYFLASGYCRDGDVCRYRHELPSTEAAQRPGDSGQQKRTQREPPKSGNSVEASQGVRKTIFQRLLEQQEEEQDKLALQVIKHLGNIGLFQTEDAS